VHLTQEAIEQLFGSGYLLNVHSPLSQPGQYAAEETVTLVGPRGRLTHVRIVVAAGDRRLTFGDVIVRVSPSFRLELHLDSDEGNATGLHPGADVLLAEIDMSARAVHPG
jgi:putative phosphotransacetylase